MTFLRKSRKWLGFALICMLAVASGGATTLVGCGPFSDVSGGQCQFVLELYYLGIAAGTSATTFDPTANVTRGQVAVFMGAAINILKRNENPFRVATRNNNNIINANYENYATANTNLPNGFCTDGLYNFVANQANNKIDIYENGAGSPAIGAYTTVTGNNRLACNGTYLWATSNYGTTVKRINLHTGVVEDPWVTLPVGGAGDIANAGFTLAVTTNTGVVLFGVGGTPITNVPLGGQGFGVIVDQNGNFWANTSTALKRISQAGAVTATVPLTASAGLNGYYPVFDGASVWVPLDSNGIDIVSTGSAAVIDHRTLGDGGTGTTGVQGGGFDGRHVYFSFFGDYGCGGSAGTVVVAYEASTHAAIQAIGMFCGEGAPYTMGFDGRYMHALGYHGAGAKHYMW